MLNIKDKSSCKWDFVSLGELLLRFDPGEARISDAREFRIWDGGAEYNVAADLSRVFFSDVSLVSALHDDAIGKLAFGLARQAGIDTSNILQTETGRNGLYFIERGFGPRAATSAFDRENTAISAANANTFDWDSIFSKGVRWFHTGGIFSGLSDTTPEAAIAGMKAARSSGAIVSYDLNYRDSLWQKRGGRDAANEVNRKLLPFTDIVFGVFDFDPKLDSYDSVKFTNAAVEMQQQFPNIKIIVSTLRNIRNASRHDLSGVCYSNSKVYESITKKDIDVFDRVGSGDAFAAGFIYGMLENKGEQFAVDCGVSLGTLAMTTAGDVAAVTAEEVFAFMKNSDATARR